MFQEAHLQLPAQHQECPSPTLNGANGWYCFYNQGAQIYTYHPKCNCSAKAPQFRSWRSESGLDEMFGFH